MKFSEWREENEERGSASMRLKRIVQDWEWRGVFVIWGWAIRAVDKESLIILAGSSKDLSFFLLYTTLSKIFANL